MPAKWEWAITWWNPAAQMRPVLDSSSFAPVLILPAELASTLLPAFSLFTLIATLSQCLCSESPYLSIKLYHIYVVTRISCYVQHSVLSAVSRNHDRSWNVLPMDRGAHLYIYIYIYICIKKLNSINYLSSFADWTRNSGFNSKRIQHVFNWYWYTKSGDLSRASQLCRTSCVMRAEGLSPFILGFSIVTVWVFNVHVMSCDNSWMFEMREKFKHCMYTRV
jgi:hypothetical protein